MPSSGKWQAENRDFLSIFKFLFENFNLCFKIAHNHIFRVNDWMILRTKYLSAEKPMNVSNVVFLYIFDNPLSLIILCKLKAKISQ